MKKSVINSRKEIVLITQRRVNIINFFFDGGFCTLVLMFFMFSGFLGIKANVFVYG
ncbi:hypothetical protein [uncultured Winogradskyella sp.]|uniref:hypothetical protein n=1 Tax=uncultured Winogradskyella sp. TaxID=395353 RepID=UPI00260FC30A|nr:hypothetical protein [uncultured Winogradskyella sp.]